MAENRIKFLSEMDNNYTIEVGENETVSVGTLLRALRKRGIMVWHEIELEQGACKAMPRFWRAFKNRFPPRNDFKKQDAKPTTPSPTTTN